MPSNKKQLVKELRKLSKEFLDIKDRKELIASLRGDRTKWFIWSSRIKGIFKNIDRTEAMKLSGILLILEQKPESEFYQNQLKKFLIEKTEYYKYYDFNLEKRLKEQGRAGKNLWTSKILRLFISRSFLGMILIVLILGFILWFYIDRESCLEFVSKVVGPFLRAVK